MWVVQTIMSVFLAQLPSNIRVTNMLRRNIYLIGLNYATQAGQHLLDHEVSYKSVTTPCAVSTFKSDLAADGGKPSEQAK